MNFAELAFVQCYRKLDVCVMDNKVSIFSISLVIVALVLKYGLFPLRLNLEVLCSGLSREWTRGTIFLYYYFQGVILSTPSLTRLVNECSHY